MLQKTTWFLFCFLFLIEKAIFWHKSLLYLIYFISLLVCQDYNQLFIHINLIKLCSKLLFLLTVVFAGSNISCLVLSVVSFLVLPILWDELLYFLVRLPVLQVVLFSVSWLVSWQVLLPCGFLWHRALSVCTTWTNPAGWFWFAVFLSLVGYSAFICCLPMVR